ncbi:HAD family hydrolase [Candidatus Pacearchaeota archaeon]|nr:HAD family hydrolase [Candidatus Pacearchaeota archaeon]
MNKAVFLDRDGVINKEKVGGGYNYKKEDITILPGVVEALKLLKDKGYLSIVVTNQPTIARGLISELELESLHEYLNENLNNLIDKFYFCPHHPEMHSDVPEYALKYRVSCNCRKPAPGMLLQASKDFNINLRESWMIGDVISDIATGKNAGCKTIMIKSPKNKEIIISNINLNENTKPDFYAKDLFEAAEIINAN